MKTIPCDCNPDAHRVTTMNLPLLRKVRKDRLEDAKKWEQEGNSETAVCARWTAHLCLLQIRRVSAMSAEFKAVEKSIFDDGGWETKAYMHARELASMAFCMHPEWRVGYQPARMLFTFDGTLSIDDVENTIAHSGQIVTVLGPVEPDLAEADREQFGECLVKILADDGWTSEAWDSELSTAPV